MKPMSKSRSPERNRPPPPALAKAVLALQMQQLEEAEQLASQVLKSDRGNTVAAEILGRALLAQNRLDEAIVHLAKFARRTDEPSIETLLAGMLAAVGRQDEALDHLRRTVARRPHYLPAFVELALQLRKNGQFDEAMTVTESGLTFEPQSADLQLALGHVLMERNERIRAQAVFAKVHAAEPTHHDALLALATTMIRDGDYGHAADLYRRALAIKPQDDTRIRLGKCLLELGQREEAEALFRTATHGSARLAAPAVIAMVSASRGRIFLQPSSTLDFLGVRNN
jgi:tetratricopeptide (TPR) repeat protein